MLSVYMCATPLLPITYGTVYEYIGGAIQPGAENVPYGLRLTGVYDSNNKLDSTLLDITTGKQVGGTGGGGGGRDSGGHEPSSTQATQAHI